MPDSAPTKLEQLWQQLADDPTVDRQRQANGARQLVTGEGPAPASLMLIGEAPGQNEDRLGRPFVGRAGQLLDRLLVAIGLNRTEIYITNLLKYRPAGNRDPQPAEIEAAQPYLRTELELVQPQLIGCLGRHAARYFHPTVNMARDNGRPIAVQTQLITSQQLIIVPCYHPAACLYNPQLLAPFQAALQSLKQQLEASPRPHLIQTQLI